MRFYKNPLTRGQQLLNAVVVPPVESDIDSDSSSESESNFFINKPDSSESDAPSINSDMKEIMEELDGSSDYECGEEVPIVELTPIKIDKVEEAVTFEKPKLSFARRLESIENEPEIVSSSFLIGNHPNAPDKPTSSINFTLPQHTSNQMECQLIGENSIIKTSPSKKAVPSHKKEVTRRSSRINKQGVKDTVKVLKTVSMAMKKVKPIKKLKMKVKWKKMDFFFETEIAEKNLTVTYDDFSPIDFFNLFFDENCLELIAQQTNLYSTQQTSKCVNTNTEEIKDFLGIELLMGLVSMPSYRDYWSGRFRFEKIADVMSLRRYEMLRSSIHFVDNEQAHMYESDRFYKIRPLLEIVRKNFLKTEHENKFSIDEMMIPYKGVKAGSRRQYIKNKPKKWGFKFFVRAGVSGFVYDFLPYAGETTFTGQKFSKWEQKYFGVGQKVVTTLCKSIPEPQLNAVYFDNWFSSVELVYYLREKYGIFSTGTVIENRLQKCPLSNDKILRKRPRGSFDYRVDNCKKIIAVKWFDNKCATLLSSYTGYEPIQEVKRFSKADKKKVSVSCPNIVKEYNQNMGGVDLADMLVSLYRTGMRTHKWYFTIFSQVLDICVNNVWLLYRRNNKLKGIADIIKLKEFRFDIAYSLIHKNKIKVGRPVILEEQSRIIQGRRKLSKKLCSKSVSKVPHPPKDVRLDNIDHFPIITNVGRCRNCKVKRTTFLCSKCNMRLCLVKDKNCFLHYHKVKDI